MDTEPRFAPRMHIWVEMLIIKRGELDNEYLNCHPMTGLLPHFESLRALVRIISSTPRVFLSGCLPGAIRGQ